MASHDTVFTFGMHLGKKYSETPYFYFLWLETKTWISDDLKDYIKRNKEQFLLEKKRALEFKKKYKK